MVGAQLIHATLRATDRDEVEHAAAAGEMRRVVEPLANGSGQIFIHGLAGD
ncbi:MAG: hypothetical protein ABI795_01830 [Chthoniobacterales bacterium]